MFFRICSVSYSLPDILSSFIKLIYRNQLSVRSLEQEPLQFELRRCKFPGWKIFGAVGSLSRYKKEVDTLVTISRENQGWLTNYNIRHNYSSPWRLTEVLSGHSELQKSLAQYKDKTQKSLASVFDKATVSKQTLLTTR